MGKKSKGLRGGEYLESKELARMSVTSKNWDEFYKKVRSHVLAIRKDAVLEGRWNGLKTASDEREFKNYIKTSLNSLRKKKIFCIVHKDQDASRGKQKMTQEQLDLFNNQLIRMAMESGHHNEESISEAMAASEVNIDNLPGPLKTK